MAAEGFVVVAVGDYPYEPARIDYERRADGWYVDANEGEGFERFALPEARERDVRQLIRKEYDVTY